jgi:hypothetical protein
MLSIFIAEVGMVFVVYLLSSKSAMQHAAAPLAGALNTAKILCCVIVHAVVIAANAAIPASL